MEESDFVNDIPEGWWMTHNSCHYLLAALVHKNSPDIAEDPTTVACGGTRDEQRKQVAGDRAKEVIAARSASGNIRGELEESMMKTKATLMAQNIELQETEAIEKQLNLMDKFKSSFVNVHGRQSEEEGVHEYDTAVVDLLNELPFMKKRKAAGNNGRM